ncbi:MAG: hypothetical protein P8Y71_25895 [Pseudolabrys sp.]
MEFMEIVTDVMGAVIVAKATMVIGGIINVGAVAFLVWSTAAYIRRQ